MCLLWGDIEFHSHVDGIFLGVPSWPHRMKWLNSTRSLNSSADHPVRAERIWKSKSGILCSLQHAVNIDYTTRYNILLHGSDAIYNLTLIIPHHPFHHKVWYKQGVTYLIMSHFEDLCIMWYYQKKHVENQNKITF